MTTVLYLCTGNSARSIMAEALLRSLGAGRFTVFSAGSHPTGTVNPAAIRQLRLHDHDTHGLRSKSWQEFAADDAPRIDIVITVCDNAAGESCPIWNGQPTAAHWEIPDPAQVTSPERAVNAAFAHAYRLLECRIEALLALNPETLTREELRLALNRIGSQAE